MQFAPTPPLKMFRRFVRSVDKNGLRGALVHSWQRLVRSLKNHGIGGTLERAFIKAPADAAAVEKPVHPFDLRHGTDTGGYISGADMRSVSMSAVYITAYAGIPPSVLPPAIRDLPLRPEDFTFVDVGCGKGRALFVAAEFPFRRLVGVELATDLCEAAWKNLALKPEWASRIAVVNEDATTFQYPEGPLLVFLFHPFLAPILRRALASLEQQLRDSPREVYLLYGRNPRYTEVLNRFPFLQEVSENSYPLSEEDAAVDYFQLTHERFTLYRVDLSQ